MRTDGRRIQISRPDKNGTWSLVVSRGHFPVFTAICRADGFVCAWFTQWVTDFDRDHKNELLKFSDDPESDVRRMLGSLAGHPTTEAA